MSEFPYDTQRCSLDFGNVLEPADVVNLTMADDPIDLQSFYPSNEFDVHATGVKYIKNVREIINNVEKVFRHYTHEFDKFIYKIVHVCVQVFVCVHFSYFFHCWHNTQMSTLYYCRQT